MKPANCSDNKRDTSVSDRTAALSESYCFIVGGILRICSADKLLYPTLSGDRQLIICCNNQTMLSLCGFHCDFTVFFSHLHAECPHFLDVSDWVPWASEFCHIGWYRPDYSAGQTWGPVNYWTFASVPGRGRWYAESILPVSIQAALQRH